ncbi:hypothetical protein O181_122803, partial [Austropuccinia psidii MF-1]|nr:hypothetical protein [Austropuccinia psidii MF-1]
MHKLLEQDNLTNMLSTQLEEINTYTVPPWNIPLELFNIKNRKDQAKAAVLETLDKEGPKTLAIFTDGSDIPNRGKGAAAIILNNNMVIKRHIPKEAQISNYETEIIGLSLAVEAAKREIYRHREAGEDIKKIFIFCDNQGALRRVLDPTIAASAQYLYLKAHQEYKTLINLVPTYLWWCPGHSGIEGNDKADKAAKEAAADITTKKQQVKQSLSKIMQKIKTNKMIYSGEEKNRIKFKTNPKILAKELNKLEKAQTSIIYQLRSAHSTLNDHLFRIKIRNNSLCEKCQKSETVSHFLTFCKRYKAQRKRMKVDLKIEKIIYNENNLSRLLDVPLAIPHIIRYIESSNRFDYY